MIEVCIKKRLMTQGGLVELNTDFKLQAGEFVTLFGPSGAGKTTLLRMIAGLTKPDEGTIDVAGDVWFDHKRRINWSTQQRHIGFVFQDYNLFPHMTVLQNLEFALVSRKDKAWMKGLLEMVELNQLCHQRPSQLSGGQRQRVALIRAILRRPKILLLDEPLSAIDLSIRLKLQDEVLKICKQFGATTIFVSHDLPEVFKLSQRVFVMDAGRMIKSGLPQEVFMQNNISGKFKFPAEIISIEQEGVVNIVTLAIGQNLTKVIATDEEIAGLKIADRVIVFSKAFNPMIVKYKDIRS